MLRSHDLFLGVLFCFSLFSCRSFAQDQVEDVSAPWRIETDEAVELPLQIKVDLNTADYYTLLAIPSLTSSQVSQLIQYRSRVGLIQDLAELSALPDWDPDLVDLISPYVVIQLQNLVWKTQEILKIEQTQPHSTAWQGENYVAGLKFKLEQKQAILLGGSVEKDAGERMLWDHTALSLQITYPQNHGKLILGDFLAQYGCGLVINTRRNFGLGQDGWCNLQLSLNTLRAYSGWDESMALRGGGTTVDLGPGEISLWASQRHRDAVLDSANRITSFLMSGLHRTDTEIVHQDACEEKALGGNIQLAILNSPLALGVNYVVTNWDQPYLFNNQSISATNSGSITLKYQDQTYLGNIEFALDQNQNSAQMGSLALRRAWLRSGLLLYHLPADYFAPLASSLDFDLGEVRNREGIYSFLQLSNKGGSVSGFAHIYQVPIQNASGASEGQDLGLQGKLEAGRSIQMAASSRWTQEFTDWESETHRWRGAWNIYYRADKSWKFGAGFKTCLANSSSDLGRLIFLSGEKNWRISKSSRIEARIAIGNYRTADYTTRLYWIFSDPSGSLRLRPVWNQGNILQIETRTVLQQAGRLALLVYWDQPKDNSTRLASRTFVLIYKYP